MTSPDLVSLVSRNSKAISFNPFIAELEIRLTGCSDDGRKIIEHNIDGTHGKDGCVVETHDRTVAALAPGAGLNKVSKDMLEQSWYRFLQPLESKSGEDDVSLYAFLRHLVTVCSSTAIYGASNPVAANDNLEQAFWDFNSRLNMLLVNFHPAKTAAKADRARARLGDRFKSYFDANPLGRSSPLAEARYSVQRKHGLSTRDMGRLEVGTLIGILVNTVPATFYLLLHVFASQPLLRSLRAELEANAICKECDKTILNMSAMRERCALLRSTFQETLRMYSEMASSRLVMEDTMLDGRFLLTKGSIPQMPNSVYHTDKSVWGDLSFQPRRFMVQDLTSKDPSAKEDKKQNTTKRSAAVASYRPFGGDSTLCPGRHFAAMEIMGLAALIVWRFDLSPPRGKWTIPESKQDSVVEGVFPPMKDVLVSFNKRIGIEGDWALRFD